MLDVIEILGRMTTPSGRAEGVVNQGRFIARNTPWTHDGLFCMRRYGTGRSWLCCLGKGWPFVDGECFGNKLGLMMF